MTQEIAQITDWSAIEDAIELWAATGTGLPQLQDEKGGDLPKIRWAGFDLPRVRPYGVLSIINDNSPGKACTQKGLINDGGVDKYRTTYSYKYDWSVQLAIHQSAYDSDGKEIRETARRYAKNLTDSYQMGTLKSILSAEKIGFSTPNKNIRGGPNIGDDEDKYIHQAIVEFRFNGINQRTSTDSDYFTKINPPTITFYGE